VVWKNLYKSVCLSGASVSQQRSQRLPVPGARHTILSLRTWHDLTHGRRMSRWTTWSIAWLPGPRSQYCLDHRGFWSQLGDCSSVSCVQVHFSVCALFFFADSICDYGHQYISSHVHTRTHTHARVWTFSICMQMNIQVHTHICTYAIYLSSYTHINTHTHRTHIIIVICTGSLQRCLNMHDIIVHVIHAGSFCL